MMGADLAGAIGAAGKVANRDARLSLLKLLASLAVVVVHTSMARVAVMDVHNPSWWWANMADAAGHLGSAMFAMVAGAVLLGRPIEQAPWQFIGGRMRRLLPAVLFWSVVYFAWRARGGEVLTVSTVWRDVLLGMPMYHLWFLFMMLAMYWVLPALRYGVVGLERPLPTGRADRGWLYLLAVLAVMTWLVSSLQALQQVWHSTFIELVPLFTVYFFAGYYLLRHRVAVPTWALCVLCAVCVLAMALGVGYAHLWLKEWALVLFYSNRGPFAMVLTCCVFVLVMRIPAARIPLWVHHLAAVTLGVYAMHPLVMWGVVHAGWGLDIAIGYNWVGQAVVVYMLSMVISWGLYVLPWVRRLVS